MKSSAPIRWKDDNMTEAQLNCDTVKNTAGVDTLIETLILDVTRDESTAAATGTDTLAFFAPWKCKLLTAQLQATVAPVEDSSEETLKADLQVDGSTEAALTVDTGENLSAEADLEELLVEKGTKINLDITEVGDGTAGAGVKLVLTLKRC